MSFLCLFAWKLIFFLSRNEINWRQFTNHCHIKCRNVKWINGSKFRSITLTSAIRIVVLLNLDNIKLCGLPTPTIPPAGMSTYLKSCPGWETLNNIRDYWCWGLYEETQLNWTLWMHGKYSGICVNLLILLTWGRQHSFASTSNFVLQKWCNIPLQIEEVLPSEVFCVPLKPLPSFLVAMGSLF